MTKPNPENCKNCSSKCAYDCATSVHNTTQNSSYLLTTIVAEMLSTGERGTLIWLRSKVSHSYQPPNTEWQSPVSVTDLTVSLIWQLHKNSTGRCTMWHVMKWNDIKQTATETDSFLPSSPSSCSVSQTLASSSLSAADPSVCSLTPSSTVAHRMSHSRHHGVQCMLAAQHRHQHVTDDCNKSGITQCNGH